MEQSAQREMSRPESLSEVYDKLKLYQKISLGGLIISSVITPWLMPFSIPTVIVLIVSFRAMHDSAIRHSKSLDPIERSGLNFIIAVATTFLMISFVAFGIESFFAPLSYFFVLIFSVGSAFDKDFKTQFDSVKKNPPNETITVEAV
jgi:hypothetical protein